MADDEVDTGGGRLPTGIDSIDRRLDGGLQAGSLVALLTPPSAQSHAILQELMKERETVYISTLRSRSAIENDLGRLAGEEVAVSIHEVGDGTTGRSQQLERLTDSRIHTLNTTERESLLDDINDVVEQIDEPVNVIIDPANPLERGESRTAYQTLLSELTSTLIDTGSLGVLHTIMHDSSPDFRESTLTVADVVWELEVVSGRRNDLEVQTRIPKNRGGDAILEKVSLVIEGNEVYTDDSRNI